MARFRSITATNTGTTVSATPAEITEVNVQNLHSAVIYVKFYNIGVPSFQDTPIWTLAVAATAQLNLKAQGTNVLKSFGTALGIRIVTGGTDSNNTAAAALPVVELEYK